ncbi:MAG: hypothetical protein AAGJ81_13685 [Verrucomicrobiota bacterium]
MNPKLVFFLIPVLASNLALNGELLPTVPLLGTRDGSQLQDYHAGEGQWIPATIDTAASLETLISRLEDEWSLRFTGKGQYIGYTDDMFSIAQYGDKAIPPLLKLIDTSDNLHARVGAVYTFHLIGIERTVFGGFVEDFQNQAARDALLSLVDKEGLQKLTMELLMRDPWPYDVPFLFEALQESEGSAWPISKALFRYNLQDIPFRQKDQIYATGLMETKITIPAGGNLNDLLANMERESSGAIVVEDGLLDAWLLGWEPGNGSWRFGGDGHSKSSVAKILGRYVGQGKPFDYVDLGNRVDWFAYRGGVFICSASSMKDRWLQWWQANTHRYGPNDNFAEQVAFGQRH